MRPILIADDDAPLLAFITQALEEQGYCVIAARDGQSALDLAIRHRPALLLVDVGMPHLSGRELVDKVRERCGEPIPSVIMSGSPVSCADAPGDQVAGYLQKPFELDALFAIVHANVLPASPAAAT